MKLTIKNTFFSLGLIYCFFTMSCNASSAVKIKLLERMEVAHNTMAFTFEKPQGFTFKAGQFGDFTSINPKETDQEGNIRGFSLTNPPYADKLMIATRMRDTAFKRTLKNLPLGTELMLDAPYGSFTLHNNAKIPAVFITGGIGITPVRSIVMQAAKDKLEHDIFLFYANNSPEDAAFLDELMALENDNPHYKFIGIMTKMGESQKKWEGEIGHLSKVMLTRYIDDITKPIYYVSGPAQMVKSLRDTLNSSGIDNDYIRTEEFSGY